MYLHFPCGYLGNYFQLLLMFRNMGELSSKIPFVPSKGQSKALRNWIQSFHRQILEMRNCPS